MRVLETLMKISPLIILIAVLFLAGTHASAGLKKVNVESEGMGSSLNNAIYDALDEAIGRINGKSIETRKQLESGERARIEDSKENYFSSEEYRAYIKTATKGVVDGYEIISKTQGKDGRWTVLLSVTVVKFQTLDSSRKRIAVFPIRIGSGSFMVGGIRGDPDRMCRILTQNLVSTLVQSRRFIVLDREYIAETMGEHQLALSPYTPVVEMARLGQGLVADYIMVGTLEDISYAEQKVKMQASGRELVTRKGNVEMSLRLIDVGTKQIAFSDFLKLKVSEKDLERFGNSLRDEGQDSGIAVVAADRVGRRILDTIYPLVVVSVNGNNVTIGQGGSQVKPGDRLDLLMYGDILTDPYTKESLGREEIQVGSLEVVRVNPKQTQARLINSIVELASVFEPKKLICRTPLEIDDSGKVAQKERQKSTEKRLMKKDADW